MMATMTGAMIITTKLHATVIGCVSPGDAYQDSFSEFSTEGEEEDDGHDDHGDDHGEQIVFFCVFALIPFVILEMDFPEHNRRNRRSLKL